MPALIIRKLVQILIENEVAEAGTKSPPPPHFSLYDFFISHGQVTLK